ncbi:MAG TPA: hypothetical protein VFW59_02410 [Gallionella sp.]|nr:hypothetical protein [Gallionella sp.]
MMALSDIVGLSGMAFALAVLIVPLVAARVTGRAVLLYIVVCMLLALSPFDGLSVAGYLRGFFGDLSVASLLLLVLALRRQVSGAEAEGRMGLLALIALAALAFYPFALGIGLFDPYRLGFGHFGFLAALLLVALLAWMRQQVLIALYIALAVLAWAIGWGESNNLWDYLLDPWVAFYALGALLKRSVRLLRGAPVSAR